MIIDSHTHIYDEKTLAEYKKKSKGRVDRIITFPYWQDSTLLRGLHAAVEFADQHEDVFALGTIDMFGDITTQLKLHRELFEQKKIVGIKLYPGYQHFFPSDERVDPIATLCAEFGKPLVFHSGMTHGLVRGTVLKYAKPEPIDEIASRHPETKIVMCHLSYPDYLDAAAALSNNDNVFSEFSGIMCGEMNVDAYLEQNVADLTRVLIHMEEVKTKILFGTDFVGTDNYLNMVEPYFELYEKLFDESERAHVFGGLAEKVYFS